MGNDPITFAMSGQRSTNELISNFEHPTRFELVSLGYKSRIIDQLYEGCVYLFLSTWRDLNPRDWVCNPVPSVFLLHSTTGACCWTGRLRSDSLHGISVMLSQLSYSPILVPRSGIEPLPSPCKRDTLPLRHRGDLRVQSDSNRHHSA